MPSRWPAPEPDRDPQQENPSDSAGPADRGGSEGLDAERSNRERWRLAWRYSEMTQGELEALAAEAGSLTELARRALQSELNRRGLRIELQAPPAPTVPSQPPQTRRMVTVRRFRDMPEALLAKSVLESAGVDCALGDANIIRTDWLWSNMLGGIKLRVQENDFETASNLLNQAPSDFETASGGEFPEAACPRCQSTDISLEELREPAANAGRSTAISGGDATWLCHSCNHRWQDADPAE